MLRSVKFDRKSFALFIRSNFLRIFHFSIRFLSILGYPSVNRREAWSREFHDAKRLTRSMSLVFSACRMSRCGRIECFRCRQVVGQTVSCDARWLASWTNVVFSFLSFPIKRRSRDRNFCERWFGRIVYFF